MDNQRTPDVIWLMLEELAESSDLDRIWSVAAYLIDEAVGHPIALEVVQTYQQKALKVFRRTDRREEVKEAVARIAKEVTSFGEVFALHQLADAAVISWRDLYALVSRDDLFPEAAKYANYNWAVWRIGNFGEMVDQPSLNEYLTAIRYIIEVNPVTNYQGIARLAKYLLTSSESGEDKEKISSILKEAEDAIQNMGYSV